MTCHVWGIVNYNVSCDEVQIMKRIVEIPEVQRLSQIHVN